MQLTHIRLLVRDTAVNTRFFTETMGMTTRWGEEGDVYVDFLDEEVGAPMALFHRDLQLHAQPNDAMVLVFECEDLERAVAELHERGAETTAIEDKAEWGVRVAYLRSPDGHLIELNTPLVSSGEVTDEEE